MKKTLLGLCITAVSLIFTLFVSEGIVRLIYPSFVSAKSDRNFWAYHERLGWFHRPGETGNMVFKGKGSDSYTVPVQINSYGFRDREHQRTPTADRTRIAIIGDSFVFGYGVEEADIFVQQIDRDPSYEAVNFGISGYSTDQEYVLYQDLVRSFSPEIVVVPLISNDFDQNLATEASTYPKSVFDFSKDPIELTNVPVPTASDASLLRKVDRITRKYSALYAFITYRLDIRRLLGRWIMHDENSQAYIDAVAKRDAATHGVQETIAVLKHFSAAVTGDGARFVLLLAPDTPEHTKPQPNKEKVAQWCLSSPHCSLVSAYPLFASYRKGARKKLYLSDDNHWSAQGHTIVADLLLETLSAGDSSPE